MRVSPEGAAVFRAVQEKDPRQVERRLNEDPRLLEAAIDGVWTLVMHAVIYGSPYILRMLLERGAAVNALAENGRTALWWAVNEGHEAMADLLLSHGAHATLQDGEAVTPLVTAAVKGNLPIVRMLLPHYSVSDVNIRDAHGRTALLAACQQDNKPIARLVLLAGADMLMVNHDGATAAEVAALQEGQQCVALCTWWDGELERGYEVHRARSVWEQHSRLQPLVTGLASLAISSLAAEEGNGSSSSEVEEEGGPPPPAVEIVASRTVWRAWGGIGPSEEEKGATLRYIMQSLAQELYVELMEGFHK